MNFGLLGRKLGHSYSPMIHKQLGSYPYDLYEIEPEELGQFLRNPNLCGLNVTIPYKKAVIPHLERLTPQAQALGAVNTIVRDPSGALVGHNTDYSGFLSLMERTALDVSGKKVLVLGNGGASATAVAVLEQLGARVTVISRRGPENYTNLEHHKDAAVIVNTTPVGMYPDCGVAPVDLACFPALVGVVDVIYNPARTKLLQQGQALGIPCWNGLWMLVAQAKESAEWFLGHPISENAIGDIYRGLCRQMENMVLIGMPGCGKSSVGALLAEKTGRSFVDTDALVESLAGKSIPQIFAEDGEAVFRSLETKALEALGKRSGIVLATGGGCVTQEKNKELLTRNGRLFWLQRDTCLLATEGRPLSQAGALGGMYAQREPLYRDFADRIVDNNRSIAETVGDILGYWEECL